MEYPLLKIETITQPSEPLVKLLHELDQYQNSLYPAAFNQLDSFESLLQSNVLFLAAFQENILLGCGAVKVQKSYGELKRLYVRPAARGKGAATFLLSALEKHLTGLKIPCAKLETGVYQHAAIALYKKLGYRETGPFGSHFSNPYSVFFEKEI